MKYTIQFSKCNDMDNLQHETLEFQDEAEIYKTYAANNCWVHQIEEAQPDSGLPFLNLSDIVAIAITPRIARFMDDMPQIKDGVSSPEWFNEIKPISY
jgi:hypothetical protein